MIPLPSTGVRLVNVEFLYLPVSALYDAVMLGTRNLVASNAKCGVAALSDL